MSEQIQEQNPPIQKKRGRPKKILTAEEKELLEQHKYEVKLKCNRKYQ